MREIKFRVPIKCNVCGFKGFQYYEWNGQSFTPYNYDKCGCEDERMEIVGSPQQYTGLKDKNGVEIYKGDIINIYYWGIKKSNNILSKGKVFWSEDRNGWDYEMEDCIEIDEYDMWRNIEVIGNIFENPELFKR